MPPQAGVTHDIVIHLNNSQALGLIVKPGTFRVDNKPSFIPRFAVGDQRGLDFNTWRSFVQESFSGGAGQYVYGGAQGNDKFAESHLVEFGVAPTIAGDIVGKTDLSGVTQVRGREAAGALTVAPLPLQNSVGTSLANLFTTSYKVFVVPHSNYPHMFHWLTAVAYTDWPAATPIPFESIGTPPVPPGVVIPYPTVVRQASLQGRWGVVSTQLSAPVLSAIDHSNTVILGLGASGIRTYDSAIRTPFYSTEAALVQTFDGKIWRTFGSRLAYWNDADNVWSNYIDIGSQSGTIVGTCILAGKLYLGKTNSLWAWEAGRVYQVQDFSDLAHGHNFSLMVLCRGAMYFNIRDRLYRLTASNLIELIDTPQFGGYIAGGVGLDKEVYFTVRLHTGGSEVWVLDAETGGTRRWFEMLSVQAHVSDAPNDQYSPASIQNALGHLYIAPVALSGAGGTTSPIVSLYRAVPPYEQTQPGFYALGNHSWLATSFLNFGYSGIDKLFNRVVVDYNLQASGQRIEVYYLVERTAVQLQAAIAEYAAGTFTDGTQTINIWPTTDSQYGGAGWTPWERFGGVPPATDMQFNVGDKMYFGFPAPVSFFAVQYDKGGPLAAISFYEYWTGTSWALLQQVTDETIHPTGRTRLRNFPSLPDFVGIVKWLPPLDWQKTTINGVNAYFVRLRPIANHSGGPRIQKVFSRYTLQGQAWQLLGTITNGNATQAALSFPDTVVSREIALKFVLYGTPIARPEILRYEVEWQPVGPNKNLLRVSTAIVAVNALETLQPNVFENSANYIQASLFSINGAGLPYIVEMPYPPPVGHTRRMLVSIASPGIVPHQLTYAHTNVAAVGAEIENLVPIVLDEV